MTRKIFIIGLVFIAVGIIYISGFFGNTSEKEVGIWGLSMSILGGMVCCFNNVMLESKVYKFIYFLVIAIIVLFQFSPIYFWFLFQGNGIADVDVSTDFVAHWGFSAIHISVIILCLYLLNVSNKIMKTKTS